MWSLVDPTFIIQICYGLLTLPLYIATFVAIAKTKTWKGTFFKWYTVNGIVNIISYLNKFIVTRLPLYTCGSCYLSPYFNSNATYWWLTMSMCIHWHTVILQPIFSTAIALDRFVVLILKDYKINLLWKKWHPGFMAVLLSVPLYSTHILLEERVFYEYQPNGNNFRGSATGFEQLYNCLILTMAVCTVIGACLNFAVFLCFFIGKVKIQGTQRILEIKLFCNSVAEVITETCATGAVLYQRIFLRDSLQFNNSRVALLFTVDAMTLLPPFFLIFTCADIRNYLFPCLKKNKISYSRPHPA